MLQQISVRQKLMVLLAIPILSLLYFSFMGIAQRAAVQKEARALEPLAELAVHISSVLHETQKERGRAAVYIGSGRSRGFDELKAQQTVADGKIAELNAFIAKFNLEDRQETAFITIRAAYSELQKLDRHRSAVSNNLPLKQTISYYTDMHADFLNGIAGFSELLSHQDLLTSMSAYVNFLKAKERAGIERAVLSGAFAADQFQPGMYQRFITLVADQGVYLEVFNTFADNSLKQKYESAMVGPVIEKTEAMRRLAQDNPQGGFGVDAGEWFSIQTQKINIMHSLEKRISEYLISAALNLSSNASNELTQYGIVVLFALLMTAFLGTLTARAIILPLSQMSHTMSRLSDEKDLSLRNNYAAGDELGVLASKMDEFLITMEQMVAEITDAGRIVNSAAGNLADNSSTLLDHTHALTERSNSVAAAGEELSVNMNSISSAAAQAVSNLSAVSAGAEEMSTTISEIANGAEKARQHSDSATNDTQIAGEHMENLTKASSEIKSIIDTINTIAEQTKLLALNATIEASRAGEAGRGFSVVAGEVKELARQVGDAARDIREKIEAMSHVTSGAADQIMHVKNTVRDVDEIVTSIAAAVEEQSVTTRDIAANILDADSGVKDISQNIAALAGVSGQIAGDLSIVKQNVEEIQGNSQIVSNHSKTLNQTGVNLAALVNQFNSSGAV